MDAAHVRTESNARRALPCVCRTEPHERLELRRCRHGQSGPLTDAAGGKGHGFAGQAPRDNVCPSKGKSLRGVDFFTRPPGAIDARPASARQIPTEESLPRLVWAWPARGGEPFQCSAPGVKTAPDADAAGNAPACRGSEHDIALPPQAAPSPTLPRQARTMKNCLAFSQAFRVSTPLSASSSEHHSGMHAPRRPVDVPATFPYF